MKRLSIILLPIIVLMLSFTAKAEDKYVNTHIINYDNPLTFEQIKSRYSSFDLIDGNITDKLSFTSEYEMALKNNDLKIMDYEITIYVKNSKGYEAQQVDIISVRDFISPTIEAKNKELIIDVSINDLKTELINNINITDNYDTEFTNYDFIGIDDLSYDQKTPIACCVYDSSLNKSNEITFLITLIQTTEKQLIYAPIYTDTTQTDSELLAEFLKKNQIDLAYTSAIVKSTYLDTPEKNGIYQADFIFTYSDGITKIYECKLINELKEIEKENQTPTIILLAVFLSLSLIGIIIYKKRN